MKGRFKSLCKAQMSNRSKKKKRYRVVKQRGMRDKKRKVIQ